MNNTIQIFGLPRSGTNFMEWSITQYIDDILYVNKYKNSDIPWLCEYRRHAALKHSFPSLEFSDFCIIIYKDFDKWRRSYRKRCNKKITEKQYAEYFERIKKLPADKVFLVNHKDIVCNFEETMVMIAEKFDLKLKDVKIVPPAGYMDKAGAMAKPDKNTIYKNE